MRSSWNAPSSAPVRRAPFAVHVAIKTIVYLSVILFALRVGHDLFHARGENGSEGGDVLFSLAAAFGGPNAASSRVSKHRPRCNDRDPTNNSAKTNDGLAAGICRNCSRCAICEGESEQACRRSVHWFGSEQPLWRSSSPGRARWFGPIRTFLSKSLYIPLEARAPAELSLLWLPPRPQRRRRQALPLPVTKPRRLDRRSHRER